jgi:dolichol-phosphate hexosyltransferase
MSFTQRKESGQASIDSIPMIMPLDAERDAARTLQQSSVPHLLDTSVARYAPEDRIGGANTAGNQEEKLKLSILMCAFNEQKTISQAVCDVLTVKYPCEIELIVVDDGSVDATADLVARIDDPRLILHKHARNRGKGAALRTAASLASGSHIVPFDADLEYLPKDIPRLIEPVLTGRFDVVYGVRLFGYNTVYQSFRYAIGNKMLTAMTNILFDSYLSDLHTCLKLMPLETFKSLRLRQNGFGLDTEVTAALLRLGYRPFEVPVSYYSRSHEQGKKINWRDAVHCLRILFRVRAARKCRLMQSTVTSGTETQIQLELMAAETSLPSDAPQIAILDAGDHVSKGSNAAVAG